MHSMEIVRKLRELKKGPLEGDYITCNAEVAKFVISILKLRVDLLVQEEHENDGRICFFGE